MTGHEATDILTTAEWNYGAAVHAPREDVSGCRY